MKLKTLYKTTTKGAIQQYDIETIDDTYIVSQGQINGKKQTYTTQCTPKNVGKKNETTGVAQAKLEALAKHAKQIKKGYSTSPTAPVTVNLPQKVQTYSKHKKKVIYPCYASPKLNGVNATYRLSNGTVELTSRGGEQYPLIEQHIDDVKQIMQLLNTDELNGEIYIHKEHLQNITAAVKKYNELTPLLEFHIFELPNIACDYQKKINMLKGIQETNFVKVTDIRVMRSENEIDAYHTLCTLGESYEGIVIRNGKGVYKHNQRSNDVFKLKKALDAEFYVSTHKLDKHGHAVFLCQADIDNPERVFWVKLKGTNEERLEMAKDAQQYHAEWLTVEYEMLSKDNIPLKPVGLHFRKCNANGKPLE